MAFLAPRPVNETVISDDQHAQPASITEMFNRGEIALHHLVATHCLQLLIVTELVNQVIEDHESAPLRLWRWHIAVLHVCHCQKSVSCYFSLRPEPLPALLGNTQVGSMSHLAQLPLAIDNISLQVLFGKRQGHTHAQCGDGWQCGAGSRDGGALSTLAFVEL